VNVTGTPVARRRGEGNASASARNGYGAFVTESRRLREANLRTVFSIE